MKDWDFKIGGVYKGHRVDALKTDAGNWLPVVDLKVIFPLMENIFTTWEESILKAKKFCDE